MTIEGADYAFGPIPAAAALVAAGKPGQIRYAQRFKTPAERFWEKVERSGPDKCWPWRAQITVGGYGLFRKSSHEPRTTAHRYAYILTHGPVPPHLVIDHVRARGCTSRACCNPSHLEAVTCRTNVLRGDSAQAKNAVKPHCPQNHPYDSANTRIDRQGRRNCRVCDRMRPRRERRRV